MIKVLMLGPARDVKGGMTSVVDSYYAGGLDRRVELRYIETVNDKNPISKIISMLKGWIKFKRNIGWCDIVHVHMASRLSTFRKGKYIRAAKKAGKRVIVHIHGAEYRVFYGDECSIKQQRYVRDTLDFADVIVVLSESWKQYFSSLTDAKKIVVIYNAVKMPGNIEKNFKNKKILFLGRLGKRKGIYDLLDVTKEVVKEVPDLSLDIGGDGEIEKVKRMVSEKGLEENVRVLGWISGGEKERLLKEASLYVLPSYNEGMPMSVLEAMAYENAVVSTNVGGIPEIIEDKKSGFLIEPGDRKALENILVRLVRDEKLTRSIARNGQKRIKDRFSVEDNVKMLVEIYKDGR